MLCKPHRARSRCGWRPDHRRKLEHRRDGARRVALCAEARKQASARHANSHTIQPRQKQSPDSALRLPDASLIAARAAAARGAAWRTAQHEIRSRNVASAGGGSSRHASQRIERRKPAAYRLAAASRSVGEAACRAVDDLAASSTAARQHGNTAAHSRRSARFQAISCDRDDIGPRNLRR